MPCFLHNLGNKKKFMGWCFLNMAGPWRLHLVVAANKTNHLRSALCFRQKNGRAEKLDQSHQEHKSCFGVKILDIRPPPWAWGATSVPCPLGSMHGLGSCKRSERNRLIPSKSHFLNFPSISRMGLGHA